MGPTSVSPGVTDRVERFRALFDASYGPVRTYALRRTAEPDDLVAEVLTIAWRRLEDIPVGAELPWLYGVARRTLGNHRRSLRRRERLSLRLAAQPPPAPPEAGSDERVIQALAALGEHDREVLRLAAWEQLGPADIALVLGCTPGAAASRLSRARRRLRDQLTASGPVRTETGWETTDD
jgi:RNA polymerase sigma-70 factor (ECF subfamily)